VTDDPADADRRGGWRSLLPVSLLVVVAFAQVTLATTAGLSPWKGGGFGMFSTTDDGGRRYVRVFVSAVERSEEISISPSLEDAARRAAVLPDRFSMESPVLPARIAAAARARWLARVAGSTGRRWRPSSRRQPALVKLNQGRVSARFRQTQQCRTNCAAAASLQ